MSAPVKRTFSLFAISLLLTSCCWAQSDVASAAQILESVRKATGGDAWRHFAECKSEGTITFMGKTGSLVYIEDLQTGANATSAIIPDLGVHQGHGISPEGAWRQDDDGSISLLLSGEAWQIDDIYRTRRGYWEPDFGGATVKLIESATEDGVTFDRLEFRVPGGHGFALWVNRSNHLIERVVSDSSTTYLSDYRKVDEVMLPFLERSVSAKEELVFHLTKRTLSNAIQNRDFAVPYQRDYDMPASGSVTVPAEEGIVFQAKIDGKGPYSMFFDTGSVNVISESFAKQLGLKVEKSPREQKWQMNGGTLDVQATRIETLQIGDLVLHDQLFRVITIPESSGTTPIAAIGYEVLRRLTVKVDYEYGQLTFYDAPEFRYSGRGTRVPITIDGSTLETQGSVEGIPATFALDTGNEVGFLLNPGFVAQNKFIERLGAHYRGYSGKDYAGPNSEAYYARIKNVAMGDTEVRGVIGYLLMGTVESEQVAGNIGRSVLRNFNVTFDAMRRAMYLEKNANWGHAEVFNRAGILLDSASDGQKVMTVLPGSPADVAGIAVGDVITRIDGHVPADELHDPAFLQAEGTRVNLTVKHGNAERDVQLTLRDLL
jgi:Aspartyl protease/PDZ domain